MKVRGRRCLLNGPGMESTAAIVAEVEDTRGWKEGWFRREPLHWDDDTPWDLAPDVKLQLSNCDRAIAFAVHWETPAERRDSLAKVDRMIAALSVFRDALAEEQKLYAVRLAAARRAGPPPKKEGAPE